MFHSSRTALTGTKRPFTAGCCSQQWFPLAADHFPGARRIFQGAATPAEVPAERKEAAEIAAEQGQSPEAAALQEEVELKRQGGIGSRIKRFFLGEKFDRKRLAALGNYALMDALSYGSRHTPLRTMSRAACDLCRPGGSRIIWLCEQCNLWCWCASATCLTWHALNI